MESIKFKLWTTIIALIFVMLTPIWYFQVVRLEQTFAEMRHKVASNATNNINKAISTRGYDEEVNTYIRDISNNDELCIFIFDASSARIRDYMNDLNGCLYEKLVADEQESVLSNIVQKKLPIIQFSYELDNESALFGSYVTHNNENYLLVISTYITPVNSVLELLRSQLMMLTIPILLAGTILAFLIAKSFTKPISKLVEATKEMAKGNYDIRVKHDSDDEIGILQDNFNYMGEQISQLEELRRDLIANVSHDLKTPLTMIRGYAETIKDLTGDIKEKRDKQLDIIIEESDRLNALVNDMLDLSRFQSDQIHLNLSTFDLNEMILNTLDRYELLKNDQGFLFFYDDHFESYCYGDVLRIKQVIYNILNNAVNHTGEDKKVFINLSDKGDKYLLEISDTGMGIAKEELNRIWDRYYKIDKSGKRRTTGTGIGLAIVKSILSSHQTLFGVKSEYGHGATFWFELPKVEKFTKKIEDKVVNKE